MGLTVELKDHSYTFKDDADYVEKIADPAYVLADFTSFETPSEHKVSELTQHISPVYVMNQTGHVPLKNHRTLFTRVRLLHICMAFVQKKILTVADYLKCLPNVLELIKAKPSLRGDSIGEEKKASSVNSDITHVLAPYLVIKHHKKHAVEGFLEANAGLFKTVDQTRTLHKDKAVTALATPKPLLPKAVHGHKLSGLKQWAAEQKDPELCAIIEILATEMAVTSADGETTVKVMCVNRLEEIIQINLLAKYATGVVNGDESRVWNAVDLDEGLLYFHTYKSKGRVRSPIKLSKKLVKFFLQMSKQVKFTFSKSAEYYNKLITKGIKAILDKEGYEEIPREMGIHALRRAVNTDKLSKLTNAKEKELFFELVADVHNHGPLLALTAYKAVGDWPKKGEEVGTKRKPEEQAVKEDKSTQTTPKKQKKSVKFGDFYGQIAALKEGLKDVKTRLNTVADSLNNIHNTEDAKMTV